MTPAMSKLLLAFERKHFIAVALDQREQVGDAKLEHAWAESNRAWTALIQAIEELESLVANQRKEPFI